MTYASLHRAVKLQITELIRQGKWKHGQRIPSEPQLARRFSCSIGTLRRAVGELVAENILLRQQGSGTYVRSHTRDYLLDVFFRIGQRDGHKELPTVTTLGLRRMRADGSTAQGLAIKPRASVIEIQTLLKIDGRPAILDRMRLPASLFPDLTESVFAQREGTVYGLFQDRYGVNVVRAEEFITAVAAGTEAASSLQVPVGEPLLRIERRAFTYKDQPVDMRERLVRCDHQGYLSLLGRS